MISYVIMRYILVVGRVIISYVINSELNNAPPPPPPPPTPRACFFLDSLST